MDELSYPNQLYVRQIIATQLQFKALCDLVKTGLPSKESIKLFHVLYSSSKVSDDHKSQLIQLIGQNITSPQTNNEIINILNVE